MRHWIDEARADYESRPWVAWALQLRAQVDADLSTLQRAAAAVALTSRLDRAELGRRLSLLAGSEEGRRFATLILAALDFKAAA